MIAIPLGDPAGIGPEIVIKTLADETTQQTARCVVVGSAKVVAHAMTYPNMPTLTINCIEKPEDGDYRPGIINLIDIDNVDMDQFKVGQVSGMCGRAAYEYIAKSIELANERLVGAVSTIPINKESLKEGGVNFIGHTEIFSALTNSNDPLTLFEVRNLRVFFLSRHVSLRRACDMVTKERIIDYVVRCTEALRKLGITEGTMVTAAGICAPILQAAGANMMLGAFAACIGSLFFSYFNDSYFWVVNNLMGFKDTKDQIRNWSITSTVAWGVGFIELLILSLILK